MSDLPISPNTTPALALSPEDEAAQAAEQTDAMTSAGLVVTVDPEVADLMGAFEETALSPEDAEAARLDDEVPHG